MEESTTLYALQDRNIVDNIFVQFVNDFPILKTYISPFLKWRNCAPKTKRRSNYLKRLFCIVKRQSEIGQ